MGNITYLCIKINVYEEVFDYGRSRHDGYHDTDLVRFR